MRMLVPFALSLLAQSLIPPRDEYAQRAYISFGEQVAAAGDVDRDGCPDLVISDRGDESDRHPPTFWIVSPKTCAALRQIVLPPRVGCVYHVEGGQDVDGDGLPDVLIGECPPWSENPVGFVHINSCATGAPILTIQVLAAGNGLGEWMHFVSDSDDDGRPDVGVLSCRHKSSHGLLTIYSSRTGRRISSISTEQVCAGGRCGFTELTGTSGKSMGFAILSEDGHTHGSTLQFFPSTTRRRAWHAIAPACGSYGTVTSLLIDGERANLIVAREDCVDVLDVADGALLRRFEAEGKTDSDLGFGYALARLGDIDADGVPDFAFSETEAGLAEGIVYAKSGRTGKTIWSTFDRGSEDTYRIGYSLAALGDVDGDGVCDLAAGTEGCMAGMPGRAFVISGKTGTIIREFRRNADGVYAKPRAKAELPR
jgi:hypothetical protein